MRILPRHDVFIIYSQHEGAAFRLACALGEALLEVGITLPGYEEMDWFIPKAGGDAPDSPDTHPAEQTVNTPMLEWYFRGVKCVVVMAGQLTEGVRVELDTLAKDEKAPPAVVVSWGKEARHFQSLTPYATLRVSGRQGNATEDHAVRLRGWVWLAVMLNDLLALGPSGQWAIGDLLTRSREAAALVAGCGRFPEALRESARGALERPAKRRAAAVRLPEELTQHDALRLWGYWHAGASLLAARVTKNLPESQAASLDALRLRLDALCTAIDARFPGAMVLDAKGRAAAAEARFRLEGPPGAADADEPEGDEGAEGDEQFKLYMLRAIRHAESPSTAELALRDYECALEAAKDAKLVPAFRHNVLLQRAELLIKMGRVTEAIDDLDEVIAEEASADEYARFSARYHRGRAYFELGRWAGAIEDYTVVADDRRAPDATRLSARLRRGVAHAMAGETDAARLDYEAVIADPRAAEHTRRTAEHNLADLASRR